MTFLDTLKQKAESAGQALTNQDPASSNALTRAAGKFTDYLKDQDTSFAPAIAMGAIGAGAGALYTDRLPNETPVKRALRTVRNAAVGGMLGAAGGQLGAYGINEGLQAVSDRPTAYNEKTDSSGLPIPPPQTESKPVGIWNKIQAKIGGKGYDTENNWGDNPLWQGAFASAALARHYVHERTGRTAKHFQRMFGDGPNGMLSMISAHRLGPNGRPYLNPVTNQPIATDYAVGAKKTPKMTAGILKSHRPQDLVRVVKSRLADSLREAKFQTDHTYDAVLRSVAAKRNLQPGDAGYKALESYLKDLNVGAKGKPGYNWQKAKLILNPHAYSSNRLMRGRIGPALAILEAAAGWATPQLLAPTLSAIGDRMGGGATKTLTPMDVRFGNQ